VEVLGTTGSSSDARTIDIRVDSANADGFCVDVPENTNSSACANNPGVDTINGWIHEMDRVLVPSEDEVSLPSQTLLELVLEENEASGEFQTLIDLLLVEAADAEQVEGRTALTTLLDDSRAGPFTVFLPTDAAFRGFSSASTSIVNDPLNVEARRSFLEFHVLLHAAGEELSPILATQYCDRLAVAGEYTTLDRGLKLRSDLTAGDTIILQGLFNEDDAAVQNCVRGELDVFVGDIAATNGVAHTTNIALVPEDGLNFESPVSDR
jgi:uncharacterized surface protein with fasciclin (FAS1) repeats